MQRRFVLLALASAALFVLPQSAYAQEAQPGDACTTNGAVRSTGGPEQMPRRMLICNGTTWQSALEQTTAGASLLQIGNDTGSCTTAKLGRMRYNGTSTWEYCNGSTWTALGGGSASAAGSDRQIQFNSNGAFGASSTFRLMADGDLLLTGTDTGTASAPVSGAGVRMFFDTQVAAFRAGSVSGNKWDSANIGPYSAAMGHDALASGIASVALGFTPTASGIGSVSIGNNSTASATNAIGLGTASIASGAYSLAAGTYNTASGQYSTAIGRHVTAGNGTAGSGQGDGSMAIGLIDDAVTITTPSQVTGIQSMGIFMGDQDGLVVSAANQMSLLGGKMVIDSTIPATNLVADTELEIDGTLKIGSGGEACDASREGSIQYLAASDTFQVCATAGSWSAMGGGASLSGLTAATAANTINNANFAQTWQWNSLTTGSGLALSSSSLTSGSILSVTSTGTSGGYPILATISTGNSVAAIKGVTTANAGTPYGIWGDATNTTGSAIGVYGTTASLGGQGIYGRATNTSSSGASGVYGRGDGTNGRGVYGHASAATGTTYGVYGTSASSAGTGVYGRATASTGTTYGVSGSNASTTGYAVFGDATATTGVNYGGAFFSQSSSGRGVSGQAWASSGTNFGVYGSSASSAGYGGYFTNTSTGVALHAAGDIEYTGVLRDMSDIRLKDNVTPLESSLEKITQLQGISFTMKDSTAHDTEYGFSAQEVQKIYPDLVHKANDEDGTLSMNYTGLIAPLVEAIKEQQKEIESLKAEIEALKAKE